MAARRARRPPSSSSPRAEGTDATRPRGRWSWPGWGMAGLAVLGAVLGTSALALIWPRPDPSTNLREEITVETLAPKPRDSVTVLVIGSDADTLGSPINKAAPAGPPNGDTVLLVRVNRRGPLQVLQVPSELALSLPGRSAPVSLGSLYRQGGVTLTREALRELLDLKDGAPERFIVVPRQALRSLVNVLGGLEVSPPRSIKYRDQSQKLTIDLQSGLQRLSGEKVEQLARYRDKWLGESGRRTNQQVVLSGLRDQLAQPRLVAQLPAIVSTWSGQVETNLTQREMLSLLAAALDKPEPMKVQSLPLRPATKEYPDLRQLDPTAPRPLWPKP